MRGAAKRGRGRRPAYPCIHSRVGTRRDAGASARASRISPRSAGGARRRESGWWPFRPVRGWKGPAAGWGPGKRQCTSTTATEYKQMCVPTPRWAARACMCMAPTRGGEGERQAAFMCVRVCVHVFDMDLAIRALCVPECTAECKRQVTRLPNGTNGADPMASCEASNF